MVYLDNAATTHPKPQSVVNSVNNAITQLGGNPGRGGHSFSMNISEKIYSVRKKVANFFHTKPENVVFTSNCTMSLNFAIKGLIKQGDHIVFSCLEHNSVVRPVQRLVNDGVVTYDIAKVYEDDQRTINSFQSLIKSNTKAVICSHASNTSGIVLPIKQIGELCKSKGIIFIVDAAQSSGVLEIDIHKMNIDILCTAGHKALYGITGTGLLILNDNIQLDTVFEGGTGSLSIELEQPSFFPDRFESGTLNTPGIISIGAGVDFINDYKIEKIYRYEYNLCKYVYDKLSVMNDIKLYNASYQYHKIAPIVSFNVNTMKSDEVVEILNKKGFALRGGLHCSPLAHRFYNTLDTGMVRFAPSIFTKESSVEQFVKIIQSISKKKLI